MRPGDPRRRRRRRQPCVAGDEAPRPGLEREPAPHLQPGGAAPGEEALELVGEHAAVQPLVQRPGREQAAARLGGVRARAARVGRRLEALLVAAREHGARHPVGQGAAQHRLGGVAVEPLAVGQGEGELDQAVVEERQPRLDGEGHGVAVLVAQQRGQQALQRVEGELPRQRAGEAARRPRQVRPRQPAQPVGQHAVLALAEAAAQRRHQRGRRPRLEGERQRRRPAEAPRHRADQAQEAGHVAARGEVAQPHRQVAEVAGQRLVPALAVEQHLEAAPVRQLHHLPLRVEPGAGGRLALPLRPAGRTPPTGRRRRAPPRASARRWPRPWPAPTRARRRRGPRRRRR